MTFQKNVENFTCENCGHHVAGTGYTNHCPHCLYSKHVDIDPGDRAADCSGLMQPIAIEGSTGKGYKIVHKCVVCGHEKSNMVSPDDDMRVVIALAGQLRT